MERKRLERSSRSTGSAWGPKERMKLKGTREIALGVIERGSLGFG